MLLEALCGAVYAGGLCAVCAVANCLEFAGTTANEVGTCACACAGRRVLAIHACVDW